MIILNKGIRVRKTGCLQKDWEILWEISNILVGLNATYFLERPIPHLEHRRRPYYAWHARSNKICNYQIIYDKFSLIIRHANNKKSNSLWWAVRVKWETFLKSFIASVQLYNQIRSCGADDEELKSFIIKHSSTIKVKEMFSGKT